MRFSIADELWERHANLTVAVLVAGNVRVAPERPPEIARLVSETEKQVIEQYATAELGQLPALAAWRAAYKAFGADPRQYSPSVEALVRRVRSAGSLPSISNLVDVYNCVSIQYLAPIGADDLDRVHGDLGFRTARGTERYVPFGSQEPEHPKAGEVIYADQATVLCRRWNWRGGNDTKVTAETRRAVLTVQAIDAASAARVPRAAEELAGWLERTADARVDWWLLNAGTQTTPDLDGQA
jgi:lysyl-tRNA synthetase class 2